MVRENFAMARDKNPDPTVRDESPDQCLLRADQPHRQAPSKGCRAVAPYGVRGVGAGAASFGERRRHVVESKDICPGDLDRPQPQTSPSRKMFSPQ